MLETRPNYLYPVRPVQELQFLRSFEDTIEALIPKMQDITYYIRISQVVPEDITISWSQGRRREAISLYEYASTCRTDPVFSSAFRQILNRVGLGNYIN